MKGCYGSGRILPSTEKTEVTVYNHICIFTKNSIKLFLQCIPDRNFRLTDECKEMTGLQNRDI